MISDVENDVLFFYLLIYKVYVLRWEGFLMFILWFIYFFFLNYCLYFFFMCICVDLFKFVF